MLSNHDIKRIGRVVRKVEGMIGQEDAFENPVLFPFPWGKQLTFGLEQTGPNKIKVLNCKARRYGDPQGTAPNQTIYYVCADKEITFAGDGTEQRICWKWNPTDGLRILDNAQTNDPMDDSTDVYGVVAIFDVTDGMATLATGGIIQCGQVITLPMFTAAGT